MRKLTNRFGALFLVIGLVAAGSVVFAGSDGGSRASAAPRDRLCNGNNAQCMIAAASSYIDALVSHDPSNVPFAPNVRRVENGTVSGTSADEIRLQLSPPTADGVIIGARDIRWFVDGDEVIAYYLLDVSGTIPPTTQVATVHLSERFKVVHGLIYEIEAIFSVTPGTTPGTSGF